MAEESESGQEKTEDPTPKKLDDAKKKGQVPRSKDLNSMAIMVIGSASLLTLGSYMIGSISMMIENRALAGTQRHHPGGQSKMTAEVHLMMLKERYRSNQDTIAGAQARITDVTKSRA